MPDMQRRSTGDDGSVLKGMLAGLVAGLAASWVMTEFQSLLSTLSAKSEESQDPRDEQRQGGGGEEPATEKAANAIAQNVFRRELAETEKKQAGGAVHYAMGATSGALYGAAAELAPVVTVGAGLPFGTAVWLVADEALVPALGLSKSPSQYPASTQVYALASHLVYGATTDLVRRTVRRML